MSDQRLFQFDDPIRPEYLSSPAAAKLGGSTPDIEHLGIEITMGNRPRSVDLNSMYTRSNRAIPSDLHDETTRSRLWMIHYAVGVHREGPKHLDRLGFKVAYRRGKDQQREDDNRVTIVETLPSTEFIERVDGGLRLSASIGATGAAELPTEIGETLAALELGDVDIAVRAQAEASLGIDLSFRVLSPRIAAVGESSSAGWWVVRRSGESLVGTHRFIHIVAVPTRVRKLLAECSITATISGFCGRPVRCRSQPIDVVVEGPPEPSPSSLPQLNL